jgi:DNA-binding NtrC family response regulator
MPILMQAKLLRVLEERQVERIGGDRTIPVDVRVVVATHRDLHDLVKKGSFREDLYHRIYVFPLQLPPLRERDGEIAPLVAHFAAQVCDVNGWKPKVFLPDAIRELERYPWPGNVRELRNMVERLLLLADGAVDAALVRLALPPAEPVPSSAGAPLTGSLAERTASFERDQILMELKRNHQRMTDTAKVLGLERSHLYKKCQALGIDLRAMRSGGQ